MGMLMLETESSLLSTVVLYSRLQSDDTRCCVNTIFPPEDGHVNARNWEQSALNRCTVQPFTEGRYQMLCEYNFSSWRWAC